MCLCSRSLQEEDTVRVNDFPATGYAVFPPEPAVAAWSREALKHARRALKDPAFAHWYECENTWFVGLDALDNDPVGRVGGSAPLSGQAVEFVASTCGGWPSLHKAQISGVFPGYPKPRASESDAAFRYRKLRFAAHVDGVIGRGNPKRRFVEEPHAFILGLPLTQADEKAAPLVVWEGSHEIMQAAFRSAFSAFKGDPGQLDVTDIYTATRAEVFETCRPKPLATPPGGAIVLHRFAVHGVAPWLPGAQAAPDGRLIAYFRPPMQGGARAWAAAD